MSADDVRAAGPGGYVLAGTDLARVYRSRGRRGHTHAVAGVTIGIRPGQAVAIVGESGSGKSTLSRLLSFVEQPTGGTVHVDGATVDQFGSKCRGPLRRRVQMIFQDARGSLDPRWTIVRTLREAAEVHGIDGSDTAIDDVLRAVGLRFEEVADRIPRQLSGGQCQRVCIARALLLEPEVLVCDEVVSALDVSVQAQIVALLRSIIEDRGMALIFVTHDLLVAREVASEVAVMYAGRVCEQGPIESVLREPDHPYTQELFGCLVDPLEEAMPVVAARADDAAAAEALDGPDLTTTTGCAFYARCPVRMDKCRREDPALLPTSADRTVACFHVTDHLTTTTTTVVTPATQGADHG